MKTTHPTGATRQRSDVAFRQEAVRLWQSSGRSARQIAQELGLKPDDLYRWQRASLPARAAGLAGLPVSKEGLQAEVVRLRHEVARLTEQRDILKKAAGILSEPSPRGMPASRP